MATEAGDAAATPAGDSAVGGGEPSEVRRFQVKRLTFCGDFDGANIALARASIDADGITEVYEVHVAPDCSGKLVGQRWVDRSPHAQGRRLQPGACNCASPRCPPSRCAPHRDQARSRVQDVVPLFGGGRSSRTASSNRSGKPESHGKSLRAGLAPSRAGPVAQPFLGAVRSGAHGLLRQARAVVPAQWRCLPHSNGFVAGPACCDNATSSRCASSNCCARRALSRFASTNCAPLLSSAAPPPRLAGAALRSQAASRSAGRDCASRSPTPSAPHSPCTSLCTFPLHTATASASSATSTSPLAPSRPPLPPRAASAPAPRRPEEAQAAGPAFAPASGTQGTRLPTSTTTGSCWR